MNRKYKIIGFDLDGTLVNSLPDLTLSLNLTFAEFDLPQVNEAQVLTWIGKGLDVLFENAITWMGTGPHLSLNEISVLKERFNHFYAKNNCHKTTLYPGVQETLDVLLKNDYLLVLVTNKPSKHVPNILQSLNIAHFFAETLGGDCLPAIKPHPAPLLYICGKLGCYPKEMLFVGDSSNDIMAAQSAGCPSVGLTYGYNYNQPISDSKPDYVCDQFDEILALPHLSLNH